MNMNFYMNGVHRSMPDLSNPNEIDSRFRPIPSRFLQTFESSQDNDSDATSREPVKIPKSRFQKVDMQSLNSPDSTAIKAGEMNMNTYSITNSQSENIDNVNTEQSDYGGSQLITQYYKGSNSGLPPIPPNRFLK